MPCKSSCHLRTLRPDILKIYRRNRFICNSRCLQGKNAEYMFQSSAQQQAKLKRVWINMTGLTRVLIYRALCIRGGAYVYRRTLRRTVQTLFSHFSRTQILSHPSEEPTSGIFKGIRPELPACLPNAARRVNTPLGNRWSLRSFISY